MVEPYHSLYTILAVLLVLLCVPIIERIPVVGKTVSFRWCIVSVILVLMIGATIDFGHLSDNTRLALITGGFIVCGIYVLWRGFEKALANGWLFRAKRVEGDLSSKKLILEDVEVGKKEKEPDSGKSSESNGLKGLAERENND